MIKIYCFYNGDSGVVEKCPHKGIAFVIEGTKKVIVARSNSTEEKWVAQDIGCHMVAHGFRTDYNERRTLYNKKFGEGRYETIWLSKKEAHSPYLDIIKR